MRVFVTGATGYIGSAVVDSLLRANHSVLGLARSDASAAALTSKGAEVQRGSLTDLDSLTSAAKSCDAVLHLAFIHDFSDYEGSCATDKVVIETIGAALEGTNKPFVVTSGTLTLPSSPGQPATEDTELDTSSAFAKRALNELTALALADKGVRASVVRLPPTNHGEGDLHAFVPMMVATARKEGVSAYIGDGMNVWPATARLDAAEVYVLALEQAPAGGVLRKSCRGTFRIEWLLIVVDAIAEEAVPIKDIATSIGNQLNLPVVSKTHEEAAQSFGFLAGPLGMNNPVSGKKTKELLGWNPVQPTLLADIESGVYTK